MKPRPKGLFEQRVDINMPTIQMAIKKPPRPRLTPTMRSRKIVATATGWLNGATERGDWK
jgi:hypothetical protein